MSKKAKNRCPTKYCRGRVSPSNKCPRCAKCHSIQWKANHPASYAYNKLKQRARERGHEFTLSKAKFKELWDAGLGAVRGKTGISMSVNRINPARGYHDDNVEFKTISENSRLRFAPLPDYLREEYEAAIKNK